VWTSAQRDAIASSFAASGVPYAGAALPPLLDALEGWARDWGHARVASCEATHVRHERSAELLDLAHACLARRRGDFEALLERLAQADETVVRRAPRVREHLPDLATCVDVDRLLGTTREPADAPTREAISAVRQELARGRAATHTGKYLDALTLTRSAHEAAARVPWPPLQVESGYELGIATWLADDSASAAPILEQAFRLALKYRADEQATTAAADLVHIEADVGRTDAALRWSRHAEALLRRLGRDPAEDARLANALGIVHEQRGEYDAAIAAYRRSAAGREREFGHDDIGVANALNNIALVHEIRSAYADARAAHLEALEIRARVAGPRHPDVGDSYNNIALVEQAEGDYDAARKHLEEALAIWREALGDEAPTLASGLNNLGSVLAQLGDHGGAIQRFRAALELREKALGADHPGVASVLKNLGPSLQASGDLPGAAAALERALTIQTTALGPEHPYASETTMYLGNLERARGAHRAALSRHERALAILEHAFPKGHTMTAQVLLEMARDHALLRAPAASREAAERARTMARSLLAAEHPLVAEIDRFAAEQRGAPAPTAPPSAAR
jgi:serine/threonine-protein kinase